MEKNEVLEAVKRLEIYCNQNHCGDAILAAYVERVKRLVEPEPVMISGPARPRIMEIVREAW